MGFPRASLLLSQTALVIFTGSFDKISTLSAFLFQSFSLAWMILDLQV